jgi:hypothetical protein
MEDAAKAFDTDIASETKTSRAPKEDNTGPPERMFERLGELETDDDSPVKAPGDDDEPPEVYTEDGEEPDDEAGEEVDEEPDEEAPEGVDPELLAQEFTVMVDGKEQTVPLKEALEGYVRTQTFHQRMNEVDEAKKIIQRTAADAVHNYEYSVNVAKEIEGYLSTLVPPEPNWDEEFKKDPIKAREVQKYYDQVRGFRKTLQDKLGEAAAERQKSDAVQLSAYAEEEAKKFDRANTKHWATDPKRKQKDLQAMRRTALTQGFSEEELSQVYDSRMLQVLLKASKYDRIMASRPTPVQQGNGTKPVPTVGGKPRAKVANTGFRTASKQLSKSGSIEDAAVVFDQIISRDTRKRR